VGESELLFSVRVALGERLKERRLRVERMDLRIDSGERPEKRGRRVGRQAEITPRQGSTEVQMTRG